MDDSIIKLNDIFFKIKPELRDKDSLSGMKIIDDMEFDSVEVVMLMAELEEYAGIPIDDIDSNVGDIDILDIINDYDSIVRWIAEVRG